MRRPARSLARFSKRLQYFFKAVGLEITVFNPALDPDGSIARQHT